MKTKTIFAIAATALLAALAGCGSGQQNLGVGVGILGASISPSDDILQTYYLGVFDPLEQIPQTVYRIRVRGQASFLSNTHFASGWVPASFIDTLNSGISFKGAGALDFSKDDTSNAAKPELFDTEYRDRRFVMFGPEGFREAPQDHRLVIVMGSDPSAFFNAISDTLDNVASAEAETGDTLLRQSLLEAMVSISQKKQSLCGLARNRPENFCGVATSSAPVVMPNAVITAASAVVSTAVSGVVVTAQSAVIATSNHP